MQVFTWEVIPGDTGGKGKHAVGNGENSLNVVREEVNARAPGQPSLNLPEDPLRNLVKSNSEFSLPEAVEAPQSPKNGGRGKPSVHLASPLQENSGGHVTQGGAGMRSTCRPTWIPLPLEN